MSCRLTPVIIAVLFSIVCPVAAQSINSDLKLRPLRENLWIHISTEEVPPWGQVDANGIAYVAGKHLLLVDTPWNDSLTEELVNWFKANKGIEDVSAIVCHYHDDCLGGLGWLNRQGYRSYSLEKTAEICREKHLPVTTETISPDSLLPIDGSKVRVFFPGPGHTVDSLAVYFPGEKILFGGCSVKAMSSRTLGNTAESDLAGWPESLKRLKKEFSEAVIVVPGHGEQGGLELIDHSIRLLEGINR